MKVSALQSSYIIDGTRMDYTPAQMLKDCMSESDREQEIRPGEYAGIIDETVDYAPQQTDYDPAEIPLYIEKVSSAASQAASESEQQAIIWPKSHTLRALTTAIISTLWKKGHFTLEDLEVRADWRWDSLPLGNMAAFYFSVEAASNYLFDLGLRLKSYSFEEMTGISTVHFSITIEKCNTNRCLRKKNDYIDARTASEAQENIDFEEGSGPVDADDCWLSEEAKCPEKLVADPSSWLVYIPFDTCEYRLGGSLFERLIGPSPDKAPDIQDPDYFIDCFEVVRELVEDGVILSATTVGRGGLAAAVDRMASDTGISMDISAISRATGESDVIRILFSEVPGILIQINDDDYDYIDAQLLLQDIAYFPIGHPGTKAGISVIYGKKPGVSEILASLIQGHCTEGED